LLTVTGSPEPVAALANGLAVDHQGNTVATPVPVPNQMRDRWYLDGHSAPDVPTDP
jgi:hypothetical protein